MLGRFKIIHSFVIMCNKYVDINFCTHWNNLHQVYAQNRQILKEKSLKVFGSNTPKSPNIDSYSRPMSPMPEGG